MKRYVSPTQTSPDTFRGYDGTEYPLRPDWTKRAEREGDPPELGGNGLRLTSSYDTGRRAKSSRAGAPGFKVTQHQLDTDSYLWYRAVRGEDCSRLPALTKPYTYFHAVGSDRALKVPVTVLNMAYREAAMLSRREALAQGRRVCGRHQDVHNERVWYYTDNHGDVWVGARLSTLTNIARDRGIDYVPYTKLPPINWVKVQWS